MRGVKCMEREGDEEMEGRVDGNIVGNEEEAEGTSVRSATTKVTL